jgi:hypothetical protein
MVGGGYLRNVVEVTKNRSDSLASHAEEILSATEDSGY